MENKKERIYISGKITGTADYMERFANAQHLLEEQNYSVLNPAAVNASMPTDTEYEEYMAICFTMLLMCRKVFMMRGWENSPGAIREHEYAVSRDYEIIYED